MKVKNIEEEVEEDLQYEERELHGTVDRFRHRVEHLTHHKAALFTTVALNLCDAVLVVLELVFDFLYFTGGLGHPIEHNSTDGKTRCIDDNQFSHYAGLSHLCHYFSIGVLSVLLLIVLAHVFASRKRFFKFKVHTLDFIVVLVAWTIDVGTYKGIHSYSIKTAIVLLIILLLLRIVRVLNSLVMIVIDGQKFQLRVMYTQKKKITKDLEECKLRNNTVDMKLKRIKDYCISKGLDEDSFERVVSDGIGNSNSVTGTPKIKGNKVTRRLKLISDAAFKLAKRPGSASNSPLPSPALTPRSLKKTEFPFLEASVDKFLQSRVDKDSEKIEGFHQMNNEAFSDDDVFDENCNGEAPHSC